MSRVRAAAGSAARRAVRGVAVRCARGGWRVVRAVAAAALLCIALGGLSPRAAAAAGAARARDARACCGLDAGVDVESVLLWRGREFADAPAAEPWVELTWGGAYVEGAGSWAFDGSWAEQSVAAGYRVPALGGTLGVGASGYFYGDTIVRTRRTTSMEGASVLEVGAAYHGPAGIPFFLLVAGNVAGDSSHAAYGEVGLEPSWRGFDLGVFAGAALNRSAYYAADGGDVVNVGVSLDRELRLSRTAAAGIGASAIYNPTRTRWWGVARAGLSFSLRSARRGAPADGAVTRLDRRP